VWTPFNVVINWALMFSCRAVERRGRRRPALTRRSLFRTRRAFQKQLSFAALPF